jgi:hypothetical protein
LRRTTALRASASPRGDVVVSRLSRWVTSACLSVDIDGGAVDGGPERTIADQGSRYHPGVATDAWLIRCKRSTGLLDIMWLIGIWPTWDRQSLGSNHARDTARMRDVQTTQALWRRVFSRGLKRNADSVTPEILGGTASSAIGPALPTSRHMLRFRHCDVMLAPNATRALSPSAVPRLAHPLLAQALVLFVVFDARTVVLCHRAPLNLNRLF